MLIDRPCGRWVPLMGGTPATLRVALAAAPCNAPMGRVSSAFAHAGPARRTAALDGFQKSPSLRRSPDGASRAGSPSAVVRRSPWIASPRRRLNRRSPARARVASATGSLRAGKIWIPLHGIILPPAAGANRSEVALAKKPGRLLRPGSSAQSPRPFWFSCALRSSSQNALIAVAIPRSVKRTTRPDERLAAKPSLPPLTFLVPPSDFE